MADQASAALPPEIQEKITRLEKLEKSNASSGYKLRAMEKLLKDAGELVQWGEDGTPLGWNTAAMAPSQPAPARKVDANGHPLSQFLGDGNYQPLDEYYVPRDFLRSIVTELMQTVGRQMQDMQQWTMGNVHLYRGMDRLMQDKQYADLAKWDSPLRQKTAELMQQRGWAKPVKEQTSSWDEWQFTKPEALREAAEIVSAQLLRESQAAADATRSGQANQGAAGLVISPQGGAASTGKVDVSSMTPEDLYAKMDADVQRNAEAAGMIKT